MLIQGAKRSNQIYAHWQHKLHHNLLSGPEEGQGDIRLDGLRRTA